MAEPEILGYVNVYRRKNGDIEMGSSDLYDTADTAAAFNAGEYDDADGSKYLGVAAVVLAAPHR